MAVGDDEHDAPVRGLTDAAARVAKDELLGREALERAKDRLAVAHDHGPTANRLGHVRPRRGQGQHDRHFRAGRRLGGEEAGLRAACNEDRTVGGDRLIAAGRKSGHCRRQRRVRLRRRKRLQDRVGTAALHGRAGAPRSRVQGRVVRARGLVDADNAPLAAALPRAVQRDALDMEQSIRVDADRRTLAGRGSVEDPATDQAPRRMPVREAEQIAVHTGDRRVGGDALLHRGDALAPEHGVVRQDRLERVQTRRPRSGDHVQHHWTVCRELDLPRIEDARHQRLSADRRRRLGARRRGEGSGTKKRDDGFAKQDPGRG